MQMLQRHMDQIDADQAGYAWLIGLGKSRAASSLSCLIGRTPGRVYLAWDGPRLEAYCAVLRDDLNWSMLICNDVSQLPSEYTHRFLDEIDAVQVGEAWIEDIAQRLGATACHSLRCETPGGVTSIWKGRQLLAYYLVVRDDMNWTRLVRHDVSNETVVSF